MYYKNVCVSLKFQFCIKDFFLKFTSQDSFLCLVSWHQYSKKKKKKMLQLLISLQFYIYPSTGFDWIFWREIAAPNIFGNFPVKKYTKKSFLSTLAGLPGKLLNACLEQSYHRENEFSKILKTPSKNLISSSFLVELKPVDWTAATLVKREFL